MFVVRRLYGGSVVLHFNERTLPVMESLIESEVRGVRDLPEGQEMPIPNDVARKVIEGQVALIEHATGTDKALAALLLAHVPVPASSRPFAA